MAAGLNLPDHVIRRLERDYNCVPVDVEGLPEDVDAVYVNRGSSQGTLPNLPADFLIDISSKGVSRKDFRKIDIFYTVLSIPLAWLILKFYWWVTPEQYLQWTLPEQPDEGEIRRLFIGINMVGIWDELFFVNTVFAVLRSLFAFRVANAVQAVVYTSVLFDMAFIGIGPLIVYFFAWTQGAMFEESENLLYVLIVHLIVDFFLVAAIIGYYYPGHGIDYLLRHGL